MISFQNGVKIGDSSMKIGQGVAKYFKEYTDTYQAKYIRKWRKKNKELYLKLNREQQTKWRKSNVELNRLRARQGMMAKQLFWDIFKLAKLRKLK